MAVEILGAAIVAGLAGAPHCIGMCGGFATASAAWRAEGLAWHAGKLSTYGILGALAGGTARLGLAPGWPMGLVSGLLLVWFALRLAGTGPAFHLRIPGLERLGIRLARSGGILARYAFGMVTGLLPCGLVYAALALAVSAGGPIEGALAMLAFGLGTIPALLLAASGLQRLAGASVWTRRLVAAVVLATGLGALTMRWPVAGQTKPACHGTTIESTAFPTEK